MDGQVRPPIHDFAGALAHIPVRPDDDEMGGRHRWRGRPIGTSEPDERVQQQMTPLRMAMAATIATGETQSPVHGIPHPVISPGISPATTPGVSTRNTTVPTHARTRTRSMCGA